MRTLVCRYRQGLDRPDLPKAVPGTMRPWVAPGIPMDPKTVTYAAGVAVRGRRLVPAIAVVGLDPQLDLEMCTNESRQGASLTARFWTGLYSLPLTTRRFVSVKKTSV